MRFSATLAARLSGVATGPMPARSQRCRNPPAGPDAASIYAAPVYDASVVGEALAAYRAGYTDGYAGVRIDNARYFDSATGDDYRRGLFDGRAVAFDEQLNPGGGRGDTSPDVSDAVRGRATGSHHLLNHGAWSTPSRVKLVQRIGVNERPGSTTGSSLR